MTVTLCKTWIQVLPVTLPSTCAYCTSGALVAFTCWFCVDALPIRPETNVLLVYVGVFAPIK